LVNRETDINKSHVCMRITNFPKYSRIDITILPIKVGGGGEVSRDRLRTMWKRLRHVSAPQAAMQHKGVQLI